MLRDLERDSIKFHQEREKNIASWIWKLMCGMCLCVCSKHRSPSILCRLFMNIIFHTYKLPYDIHVWKMNFRLVEPIVWIWWCICMDLFNIIWNSLISCKKNPSLLNKREILSTVWDKIQFILQCVHATHTWAIKYRKGMTFLFVLMKLILPSWCAEEIISWNDEYKRFWRTIPVFVCEFQSFFSLSLPLSLSFALSPLKLCGKKFYR